MVQIIHFIIAYAASVIGAISGIGGGIIIKPLLDRIAMFDIIQINFLSGCTVLAMTAMALIRNRSSEIVIHRKIGGIIAVSGIVGGLAGKYLFTLLLDNVSQPEAVKTIQTLILLILTAGVLVFTLFKQRVKPRHHTHAVICILTGLILGLTGAFLGIGGGPINLMVLYLLFAMDSKTAAINSIFVIFFSQLASLILTIASGNVPEFDLSVLILMILGGIAGALTGSAISRRITHHRVDRIFMAVLVLLIVITTSNLII